MFAYIIMYMGIIGHNCKTNCKMFDSAKVMVGYRILGTRVGSGKNGSAV